MLTLNDLVRDIRELKEEIRNSAADRIADIMYEETMDNFEQEGYGNDGSREMWADRQFEDQLRYPKLDYTGSMKRSIVAQSSRAANRLRASVGSNNPLVALHNEGGPTNGKVGRRRPPKSTRPLRITASRVPARKFLGIGRKTVDSAIRVITRIFDKHL